MITYNYLFVSHDNNYLFVSHDNNYLFVSHDDVQLSFSHIQLTFHKEKAFIAWACDALRDFLTRHRIINQIQSFIKIANNFIGENKAEKKKLVNNLDEKSTQLRCNIDIFLKNHLERFPDILLIK